MSGCDISSPAVVYHHLNMLEKQGHIRRDPEVSRSIQLVGRDATDIIEVPLLGTIAAGEPIPVPGSDSWAVVPEDILKLPADMLKKKGDIYALRVKGTSMIDALIADGDIVIMEPAQSVENGDTVAVWLNDQQEVTLKKIYRESGRIRLQPANPQMEPIFVSPDEIEVQGKLRAVIRISGHHAFS